jgi:hypothetical protein
MKTMLVLLLALVSLSATGATAFAQSQPVPANLYECRGNGVVVTYSTTSFTGEPTIAFRFRNSTISRSGDDIQTQDTVLGSLVTIIVRAVPDSFSDTLTLVAPDANLTDSRPRVTFVTRLYRTHTLTSIGGPALVEGLIQQSASQRLVCTASAVNFV